MTEYKFGLGKDRRVLSYYQSKNWLDQIKWIPKKFPDRKGEAHPRCKLSDEDVKEIFDSKLHPKVIAAQRNCSEGYVRMIKRGKRRKK